MLNDKRAEPGPVIPVTALEYDKATGYFSAQADLRLRRVPEEEEALAEAVMAAGSGMVILGASRYGDRLYAALERSRRGRTLIARFGVGIDGIDRAQCRQRNILIANTPGVLDTAVAELTLALLASLARNVGLLSAEMKAGGFRPRTGLELRGKRLALIGFGAIGRRVAQGAHAGFGMRVTAADRLRPAELEKREGVALAALLERFGVESYVTDVEALLAAADVVSLHLPALPDQRPLLDRACFARMKRGAFLVNTARGSLIDEIALFDALSDGRLAGAALDVFAQEPYVPAAPDKDLRTLPTVLCTPHIGSNTVETNLKIAEACVRNVRAFVAGKLDEMSLAR